jgi:hypothetical protein
VARQASIRRSFIAGEEAGPGATFGRQLQIGHPIHHAPAILGHAPSEGGAKGFQFSAHGAGDNEFLPQGTAFLSDGGEELDGIPIKRCGDRP